MRTRKSHVLMILAVVNSASFGGSICAQESPPSQPVVTIGRAYVHFFDQATLAFQRGGVLAKIPVKEGDVVVQGAILAQLDDRAPVAALAIAEADAKSQAAIRSAEVELDLTKIERRAVLRANELSAGAYPEAEVERRRVAVERANYQLEQARHEHHVAGLTRDKALVELSSYRLESPFAGTVAKIHKTRGNSVQTGEPIVELVDLKQLRVQGFVNYGDAWKIKPGDRVVVRVTDETIVSQLGQNEFEGELKFIETSVENVRRVVGVWALIENTKRELRDGMAVEMEIYRHVEKKAISD